MMQPLLAVDGGDVGQWFKDHGAAIFGSLLLALIGAAIVRRLVRLALRPAIARQMAGRDPVEVHRRVETLSSVIERTAQVVFILWALFTILPEFGISIAPALTAAGITGIALAFGAQTLVRDAINGMFILGENQYANGDVVTISGVTGKVEDVSLRRTLLRDDDGVLYTIPNGSVVVAANYTRDYARVRVSVPVAINSDLGRVRAIADDVGRELAADPAYANDIMTPPAYLRVESVGPNGVTVEVTGNVRPGKQWDIAGELRARLLEALVRDGVKTPWG